eukprot:TRINITY_DN5119_c0_g1_i1.p1 TRINITY_DN5119_c0_g1~~TRINITY_DN5119_c0_g1_i1.p1  ORF type:complete len:197 (-),score=45.66 TRINITY_DN5119_c0_g1_i1:95-685(-)
MQNRAQQLLQQQQRKVLTTSQISRFKEGLKLILDRWYILNLAVEMRWGSGEPSLKKEILFENILDLFITRKDLDELDLEDFFDEFFQVEFQIQAEDGSLQEVARDLITFYFECSEDNYQRIDHLQSYQPFPVNKDVQLVQSDNEDEEDGDEDAMEVIEEEQEGDKKQQEQQQQQQQNRNTPVVDDDGFQLVQRKRR